MLLINPLALESRSCILWSTSKAFKITLNDNLKVHKASALAPQRVSQSVRSLARLPICFWRSGVSFNVSRNWCFRLAEKENENAISCTVDIMFLIIQWFFNSRRFNLVASFFVCRKYFVRNFKCLSKFASHTTVKSQAGRKKSVRPGLRTYRLATPLASTQP